MNSARGWFRMHRGWMQSADFKPEPFTEPQAFIWSIEQAAHGPHLQWFNGVQYQVDRGEFVTSLHSMMTAFGWSEKRVRGFVQRMSKAGKWAKRGANAGAKAPTVLIVCNYALYQAPARDEGEAAEDAKGEPRAKQGRSEGEEQKEGITNSNELERTQEEEASPRRSPNLPYAHAIAMWAQAAAIKGWTPQNPTQPLSDKRRKGLGTILKTHGLDAWRDAIQRAIDSDWLGGPDPPAWFNFSFICNPENFTKLSEGNYDRTFSSSRPERKSGWLAANASLTGNLQAA